MQVTTIAVPMSGCAMRSTHDNSEPAEQWEHHRPGSGEKVRATGEQVCAEDALPPASSARTAEAGADRTRSNGSNPPRPLRHLERGPARTTRIARPPSSSRSLRQWW